MNARRWTMLGVLAFLVLARVVVSIDPLPAWGADPLRAPTPVLGIGPAASIAIDACLLMLGGLTLVLRSRNAPRAIAIGALGVVGATFGVLLHGRWLDGISIDDLRIGLSWVGGFGGAIVACEFGREPLARRALVAVLLSVGVLLFAKGAMQVFIEHAETVRAFRVNREAFLANQGWAPDSAQARAFERRLSEPSATGWFGLTNVCLSVALACALGLGAMAWRAVMGRVRGNPTDPIDARTHQVLIALLIIAAAVTLGTAFLGPIAGGSLAKGAVGAFVVAACALGAIGVLASPSRTRDQRVARIGLVLIPLACVAIPLGAVVARGLVGERMGELSLWFRWFYLQGAARIIAEHPLLGVGPDGFQTAYQIAKPAISPENVVSPHSVLLDWVAGLGVLGVALGAAWLLWIARSASGIVRTESPTPPDVRDLRAGGWWIVGVIGAVLIWNVALQEWPIAAAVPEATFMILAEGVVRVLGWGLAWGVGAAAAFVVSTPSSARLAAIGATLVIAAHAQIEMTLTTPGGGAWALALLGVALAPARESERGDASGERKSRGAHVPALIAGVGLAIVGMLALLPVWRVRGWERDLRESAAALAPVTRLGEALANSPGGATPELIDQAESLGLGRPANVDDLIRILEQARFERAEAGVTRLFAAATRAGDHAPTLRAAARASATMSTMPAGEPDAFQHLSHGVALAERAIERQPANSSGYSTLASVLRARSAVGPEPAGDLLAARAALESGSALDPHGIDFPKSLVEVCEALGDDAGARAWAARALQANANLRLDPLAQLTDRERRRLERLAGER